MSKINAGKIDTVKIDTGKIKRRNTIALNPYLRKGGVHQKTNKAKRTTEKARFRKSVSLLLDDVELQQDFDDNASGQENQENKSGYDRSYFLFEYQQAL